MFEVHAQNAANYLRSAGRVESNEPVEARELAGGVSNVVLLITLPARRERLVLKQARGQLRVKDDWRCPIERIWREVRALEACGKLLALHGQQVGKFHYAVPRVLWEDRENFLYAMTAASSEHGTWKELLFAGPGDSHRELAQACGKMLGAIHAGSWNDARYAAEFDERTYFELLRVDPYYRQISRRHPDLTHEIDVLIASVEDNRLALVHGDYSPKNLLVWPGNVLLIDFEVGHFGDPGFDLGFFLTHLVLKSIWAGPRGSEYLQIASEFWLAYVKTLTKVVAAADLMALEQRAMLNLAGCLLARVDGKSPVDYLSAEQQAAVRGLAREWLRRPACRLSDVAEVLSGAE